MHGHTYKEIPYLYFFVGRVGLRKGGPISGLRGSYNWNKNFCLQIDRPITKGAYNRYFTMSIINVREKISLSHSRIFSPYILPW